MFSFRSPKLKSVAVLFFLIATFAFLKPCWADESVALKSVKAELQKFGIELTNDGLKKSLETFDPAAADEDLVNQMVAKLSSDNYQERMSATKTLAQINPASISIVRAASNDSDLEVRLRIQQVLKLYKSGSHLQPLRAVLKYIELKNVTGLLPKIWTAMTTVESDFSLTRQFRNTLVASAAPSDVDFLRQQIADSQSPFRTIALESLVKVLDKEMTSELFQLANSDTDAKIRLIASRELAKQLDRRCLPLLVALLESEELKVRVTAAQVLQSVTGEKILFYGEAKSADREKSISQWKEWLAKNGSTTTLLDYKYNTDFYVDRLVVSDYSKKIVTIRDLDGKILRTLSGLNSPYGVIATLDGHIIIAEYSGAKVTEYDENDQMIKSLNVTGMPISVQRLENGNTLVALSDKNKVVELDTEGKVVWEFTSTGRIQVARRTPEGTTLLSENTASKVIEVDAAGKIIRELKVKQPQGARRLKNGNLLVCQGDGTVNEYDSGGRTVWTIKGLTRPIRAQKMNDGNFVVMDQAGIKIFDESGKLVREIKTGIKSGTMQYF